MSAATALPYDQPIGDHYGVIFTRHLRRTNEPPPTGWQRGVLQLPQNASRVDPREEVKFMEDFVRMIYEKCSNTDPKNTNHSGFWIRDFDGSETVNKYLRGATLKMYPGDPMPESVWLDIAPTAGPWSGKGPFT